MRKKVSEPLAKSGACTCACVHECARACTLCVGGVSRPLANNSALDNVSRVKSAAVMLADAGQDAGQGAIESGTPRPACTTRNEAFAHHERREYCVGRTIRPQHQRHGGRSCLCLDKPGSPARSESSLRSQSDEQVSTPIKNLAAFIRCHRDVARKHAERDRRSS